MRDRDHSAAVDASLPSINAARASHIVMRFRRLKEERMHNESSRFYVILVIVACMIALLLAAYATWGINL